MFFGKRVKQDEDFSTRNISCTRISMDPWVLSYNTNTSNTSHISNECGVLVGNGKIGVHSSFSDEIGFDGDSVLTGAAKYVQGTYSSNVIHGFRLGRFRFFNNNEDDSVSYVLESQTLNMNTAILTTSYIVTELATGEALRVAIDVYAPYNLPFCLMQTLHVTRLPGFTGNDVLIYHEPIAASDMNRLGIPSFDNSLMDYNGVAAHVLNGVQQQRLGEDVTVAFASSYWTDTPLAQVGIHGFNVYRHDEVRCYCKMTLSAMVPPGAPVKLHCLSTQMSSLDYVHPLDEVKRISLYLSMKANAATTLRSAHVLEWAKNWQHTIEILPKDDDSGITLDEKKKLVALQQRVNYAVYNIWSSFRDSARLELNAASFSVLDTEGNMLFEGDLWMLPLLIMLKPETARSILEYRYKTLTDAIQLAASLGFKGAKYPSANDVLGYKNALYWDIGSAMHIHNTCLVAINVWNYYRITNDKNWLTMRGYPMLRSIAEFLISKVEIDDDSTYHLRDIIGLTGKASSDLHGLSVHLLRFAVKCAIEASYEIAYAVPDEWSAVYHELQPPTYANEQRDILKIDNDASPITDVNLTIIEPWLMLLPGYGHLYFAPENMHTPEAYKSNLDYYKNRIRPDYVTHPYNIATRGILNGLYAQYNPVNSVDAFETELNLFLQSATYGEVYGNLAMRGLAKKRNSLTMSAMFLTMLLSGIAQMTPAGGVSEGRFYYEEMKVKSKPAANMPRTWKAIKVLGAGKNNETLTTLNSTLYVPCGCP